MSIGKHRNSLSALIVFRQRTLNFKLKVIATTLNRARSFSASAVFTELCIGLHRNLALALSGLNHDLGMQEEL